MTHFPRQLPLCLALLLPGSWAAAADATYGVNLLRNPGAEASTGSADGVSSADLPKWLVTGPLLPVRYGAPAFPAAGSPGPANRRANFFSGGPSNAESSATQTVSLAALASDIDAGLSRFRLSGFLGGFSSQEDHAVLSVRFLSATGAELAITTLPSVSATDRANVTGLLKRQAAGRVPRQARSAEVTLQLVRTAGSYNDGYADSLVFTLEPKP